MAMRRQIVLALVLIATTYYGGGCSSTHEGHALGLWRSARLKTSVEEEEIPSAAATTTITTTTTTTNAEFDRIAKLYGQPGENSFRQYGGYIDIDQRKETSLFYYFAEAADHPATKPLVLWLNGGPGCSSLLGAFLENGPFGVNPDGKTLYRRRFSWNRVANMLYVESPVGVGFSYTNTSSEYKKSGDKKTAEDAWKFIVNWLEKFPRYKSREFFIAGESYAGYYIPELADLIVKRNKNSANININLKGIMIGNGILNEPTDNLGWVDFLWTHSIMSDEVHKTIIDNCRTGDRLCIGSLNLNFSIGNLDLYDIYAPLCLDKKRGRILGYDPCEGNSMIEYFNLAAAQKPLHANITKLPYKWEVCSGLVGGNWDSKGSPSSMFPIYDRLMAAGLKILLYSGDVDGVVPVTGTRYGIAAMNLKVQKEWAPWYSDSESTDLGGFLVDYRGLSFATVRGAGHMVPQTQPRRAFALFTKFLNGVV
ncbi:hypothetical protein ABFS83_02G025300 [Erythranthe nasuta]